MMVGCNRASSRVAPAADSDRLAPRWRLRPPSGVGAKVLPGQQPGGGVGIDPQALVVVGVVVRVDRGGGDRGLVGVDADGDHGRPFVARTWTRDGQPDFRRRCTGRCLRQCPRQEPDQIHAPRAARLAAEIPIRPTPQWQARRQDSHARVKRSTTSA
jgi:hypothetical protein